VKIAAAIFCAVIAAASGNVFAQSASGSIYGQADPGSTIVITSQDTGLTRSITAGSDGKFSFSTLPTGTYSVTETSGSKTGTETARVNAGIGTAVNFTAIAMQEVMVFGTKASPIDTTTSQVSTTFSASQLSELPVVQSVLDVALLAPGVIRGTTGGNEQTTPSDEDYSKSASFGGASVAENQYYINGFNVTNLFRNLQYADLPFYAIDSEQIVTGGYGPEFGLATGGVVNIQTKKGTNDWKVGAAATWEPNQFRAIPGPAVFTNDGQAYRDFSRDTDTTKKYDLWAGGPIIPDKLFFYAIGEFTKEDKTTYPNSWYSDRNIWDQSNKSPFALAKIDYNINDRNILEITGIKNSVKYTTAEYGDNYNDAGFVIQGPYSGTDVVKRGGWIGIAKYTSYITDALTASLEYGQLHSDRKEYQYGPDGSYISYNGQLGDFNQPGCPAVTFTSNWRAANPDVPTGSCYVTQQINSATGKDERKSGRIDLEYKLDAGRIFGSHTFKGGYDFDKWESVQGESYAGGSLYTYYAPGTPYIGTPYETDVANSYVRVRHFETGAAAGVDSNAFYLKDDWQVIKNLVLQVGVRNDSFKNKNGANETYLKQDDIWQPRVGFAWDVTGDSKTKLYGSYGIYSLPVTAGVSIRGASASIYSYQYYNYTSVDPKTGAPVLGGALGPTLYYNGETGAVPAPGTFAATDLGSTKQKEFIVGFQQDIGKGWSGGVRLTYRELLKTIDDMCDSRPFDNWAARTGFSGGTANIDANVPCFVINPGYGAHVNYDVDGNGTLDSVNLTSQDIGLPKAERKYIGAEFTLEKAYADHWLTQLSYTWAHNYGNAEGLADSDIQQLDIGTTEAFDFPEIMRGSYGNLPNDHRHTFKSMTVYKPIADIALGMNLSVQSGKPINCIGAAPFDVYGYGAAYHYCNDAIVPRGSVGTTDTITDLDLSVAYSPHYVEGLTVQLAVFNVANSHGVTNVDEFYTDSQYVPQASYLARYSYQSPRYLQLNAKYEFDFSRK
jgi:hypothetical protein